MFSQVQQTQRCAKLLSSIKDEELVKEATQLVRQMFTPGRRMPDEEPAKPVLTGKKLKNRRKRQKKIEKRILQQIVNT